MGPNKPLQQTGAADVPSRHNVCSVAPAAELWRSAARKRAPLDLHLLDGKAKMVVGEGGSATEVTHDNLCCADGRPAAHR
jgi:hypothetical protein